MEKPTVLVIDDDLDALVSTTAVLASAGYRVLSAVDVSQAIELARENRPQVVLLDHQLPVVVGLDAVETLRHEPALLGAAIVIVSSRQFARPEVAHLDGYVRKPWTVDQLLGAIERSHGLALRP
jgi:CheY-like chemotaxis protein